MRAPLQLQAQSEERTAQLQAAAAARETELQGEFEALSTELMRHIEQLQAEVQGLLSFKQHKVCATAHPACVCMLGLRVLVSRQISAAPHTRTERDRLRRRTRWPPCVRRQPACATRWKCSAASWSGTMLASTPRCARSMSRCAAAPA
jgi:hypothetical protein